MSLPDPNCTMRCSTCANNWPFYRRFIECPLCETPCSALRFNSSDDILTVAEANEILRDHGLPTLRVSAAPTAAEVKTLVAKLNDDLDSWAIEAPPWVG